MKALIFTLFACFAALTTQANAERRVAFLVGNANYQHTSALANPINDVTLIAETLAGLDFEVDAHTDLSRDEIASALAGFLRETSGADLTVFYFAGHGLQFEGQNYLVGVDGRLASEFDVESETLNLDRIVTMLERNSRAAIVFVDACRNNPLAEEFYRTNFSETRAAMTRGLAPVVTAFQGTMITFSASPGQVAYDGDGNSPFALSLARHLPTENIEILSAMKRVIRDVQTLTEDRQTPMLTNDLTAEIYLKLDGGDAGAALAYQQEETMFEAALLMQSARAWELYFQRFPDGYFHEMAVIERQRIADAELAAEAGVEAEDLTPEIRFSASVAVAETAERALGLGPEDVRAIQAALNALGYDAGPADGILGRGTRKAIADFQLASGLPSTGVVTAETAQALGIELVAAESSEVPVYSSRDARRYNPDELALIEDDARLIRAVRVLQKYDLVYGFYQGRVYIAVQTWQTNRWADANALAESAGGHLATLTTPEENEFVYELVRHDDRFWKLNDTGRHTALGPVFGFYQAEGGREPDGGWRWVTGEPVDYVNWEGTPSNSNNNEWVGHFQYNTFPDPMERLITGPQWGDLPDYIPNMIIEIE